MKIKVKVKPNSKKQTIEANSDDSLTIGLKSPPVDGKANRELIALLSAKFHVPQPQIEIKSGLSSKHKLVVINCNEQKG